MGRAIGIDLGTTNSVVAVSDGGVAKVLLNSQNEKLTRSVVGIHKKSGQELIGTAAYDYAPMNPENSIISIKRLMGRFKDDPEVERIRSKYHYSIVAPADGSADVRVVFNGREHTPTEISAKILRKLKEDAEKRLGQEVTHAVITVPAYFSNLQRIATRDAGELAGLRVKAIIDEPTAAAISFGVGEPSGDPRIILVYDLGGGTFDVSLLMVVGDSTFNQMNIEGDMWLGGDDFDHMLMDYVVERIQAEHRVNPRKNLRFMWELKHQVEKAKKELSEMHTTTIMLMGALQDNSGESIDLELDLSRAQFESLIRTAVEDKSVKIVHKAIEGASLTAAEVYHVLLVGGSSTIPLVQSTLEREFGRERIRRSVDPMTCVAEGAAVLAERLPGKICPAKTCGQFNANIDAVTCTKCGAALAPSITCGNCGKEVPQGRDACPSCNVQRNDLVPSNVTAKAFGIETEGSEYTVIVPKGFPYPTLEGVICQFHVAADTSTEILIPVFHGESHTVQENEFLGNADIELKGAHVKAGTPVEVEIGVDRDGCLDIRAEIKGTALRRVVRINPSIGVEGRACVEGVSEKSAEEDTSWKAKVWFFGVVADIACENFEWVAEPHKLQSVRRLVAEAKKAEEGNDPKRADEIAERLANEAQDTFGFFNVVAWALFISRLPFVAPGTSQKIRSLISEASDLARMGAPPERVMPKLEQAVKLAEEASENRPEGGGPSYLAGRPNGK